MVSPKATHIKNSDSERDQTSGSDVRESLSKTGGGLLKALAILTAVLLLVSLAYVGWRLGLSGKMLLQAVKDGNEQRAERLIRWGARVDARDAKGRTPLHIAAEYPDYWIVCDALINAGADVNAVDMDGNTPAHFAVREAVMGEYDYQYAVDFLSTFADAGADFESKNKKGECPVDPLYDQLGMVRLKAEGARVLGYRKGTPQEEIERRLNDPKRLAHIAETEERVREIKEILDMVLRNPALAGKGAEE